MQPVRAMNTFSPRIMLQNMTHLSKGRSAPVSSGNARLAARKDNNYDARKNSWRTQPLFFSLLGMLKKIRKNTLMPSTTGVWYHKADILIRGLIAFRTQKSNKTSFEIQWFLIFWFVSTLARKPTSILIWRIAGWKIDTLKMYFRLNLWIFQPSMFVSLGGSFSSSSWILVQSPLNCWVEVGFHFVFPFSFVVHFCRPFWESGRFEFMARCKN